MRDIRPFCTQRAVDDISGKIRNLTRMKKTKRLWLSVQCKLTEQFLKVNLPSFHLATLERHTSETFLPACRFNYVGGMSEGGAPLTKGELLVALDRCCDLCPCRVRNRSLSRLARKGKEFLQSCSVAVDR